MNKQDFIAQLERNATNHASLTVTSAVMRHLAQVLKAGDPEWWKLTSKAWEKRKFVAWSEASWLFMTALHYEALSDEECPLVPFFPSCGGTDEADPASGVTRFLPDAPDSFYEHLRDGHRRVYTAPLAPIWPMLGSMFFHTRDLPFYAVEVGSGGGLNLGADALLASVGYREDGIAARIGLDEKPLILEDLSDRRWLTASLPPDSSKSIAALDATIDSVLERQRRDPNFLQLVKCQAAAAPTFISKNIPSDDEDVGLLIYNTGVTARMTDPDYQKYAQGMVSMMKPWGERALWIEVERVRGELYSTTIEVRAVRYAGEAPVSKVLFRVDAAAPTRPSFMDAAKFLHTAGATVSVESLLKNLPS